jgi:hypothetical protein
VWLGRVESFTVQELTGMTGRHQCETLGWPSCKLATEAKLNVEMEMEMESLIANQGANLGALAGRPLLF